MKHYAFIGIVHLLSLHMKLNFGSVRSLQARTTDSKSDDGGTYVHAELAIVDSLAQRDYSTSIGLAFRKDEMSKEAKNDRQALVDAQAKGTDEYDRVRKEQLARVPIAVSASNEAVIA